MHLVIGISNLCSYSITPLQNSYTRPCAFIHLCQVYDVICITPSCFNLYLLCECFLVQKWRYCNVNIALFLRGENVLVLE